MPVILVTGASGFVGSNFINAVKEDFFIFAIARRNQQDAGIPFHDNIQWLRCDIADADRVAYLFADIAAESHVDYLFHFAGYYDFTNKESSQYQRTNVDGTRHVLENAEQLRLKRFIYSSSLAVTAFAGQKRVIDERSVPDDVNPYGRSKGQAEQLVAEFSIKFPCTIARLAAIYSDWCEYGPLYTLLQTWTDNTWLSRFIAGQGITALPFLHVQDLNAFMLQIIRKRHKLGNLDILAASPSGCISHNDLFKAAALYTDQKIRPIHIPVWCASLGVIGLNIKGMLTGVPPFERPWMMRYIDQRMDIDSSVTQDLLEWTPKHRFYITRRLLFLIENMRRNPLIWDQKNIIMARRAIVNQPGLSIYNAMLDLKKNIIGDHIAYLTSPANRNKYPHYFKLVPGELHNRVELIYLMFEAAMRLGDKLQVLNYARHIARERFKEGFDHNELKSALKHLAYSMETTLHNAPGLEGLENKIHHEIVLTMQLILDEIEDVYETLQARKDKGAHTL